MSRRGSGPVIIANRLEDAGLIDNADVFKLVTQCAANEANFKGGVNCCHPGAVDGDDL